MPISVETVNESLKFTVLIFDDRYDCKRRTIRESQIVSRVRIAAVNKHIRVCVSYCMCFVLWTMTLDLPQHKPGFVLCKAKKSRKSST